VFVLAGARYVEKVQNNAGIQAFLAGVSAAVVGVIAVVSLELIPEAIVGWPTLLLAVAAFLSIVWFKVDVALVAICGIVGGVIYAVVTH
jgi:chromate transport protein ChrA